MSLISVTSVENDGDIALISVYNEEMSKILEQLNENENIEYAQLNYRVALSEININQWGLQNAVQSVNTMQVTKTIVCTLVFFIPL